MAKIAKKTAENGHFLEAVKCQKIELRTVYRYINGPPGIGINFSKKKFFGPNGAQKVHFSDFSVQKHPLFCALFFY